MSIPSFKVKALYEYTSQHDDDLHFPHGQVITVIEEEDDEWYMGEYLDASGVKHEGIFPKNFVEKYEPTAPPRPTRTSRSKKESEPEQDAAHQAVTEVIPDLALSGPVHEPEPGPGPEHEEIRKSASPIPKALPASSPTVMRSTELPPPSAPEPIPASKPSGLLVSENPTTGSFKDRIAAFNKATPPPAPFKPGGLGSGGSNNFIKKPFVAPPPSKNAYVPLKREPPPQNIYRREIDAEITVKEAENQEKNGRPGLAQDEEDQAKPTSLKERIALLQKQQMEQAARYADALHKKEKPKRPLKKHTEFQTQMESTEDIVGASLEKTGTGETLEMASIDPNKEEQNQPRKRKPSRGASIPGVSFRKSFGDGNEADMSGAGDTTEELEDKDDSDEKPKINLSIRTSAVPTRELGVGEKEDEGSEGENEDEEDEGDEEEDIEPEVRRREELRARMAKMSGGMGMHGIFGPPGGMPMPGILPPKKKKTPSATKERHTSENSKADLSSTTSRAPPVPMIPIPGISRPKPEDIESDEGQTPISTTRPLDESPDFGHVAPVRHERVNPKASSVDEDVPQPIPGGRPAPPPVPKDSRPPTTAIPMSPSAGSESDDELSPNLSRLTSPVPNVTRPPPGRDGPGSPRGANPKRASVFVADQKTPTSPTIPGANKRASRIPPPIPGGFTSHNRAPPPPPPGASSLSSTDGLRPNQPIDSAPTHTDPEESEEEVTEYEGDYDTDIASTAPHKDALKVHARDPCLEEDALARSSIILSSIPPPLPSSAAPRGPPPLPSQPPPNSRRSTDMPRSAPPAPPPNDNISSSYKHEDDEYDPFRYTIPKQGHNPVNSYLDTPTPKTEKFEEDLYSASPPQTSYSTQERSTLQPSSWDSAVSSGARAAPRQSLDASRSGNISRRSTELTRMSLDSGHVAHDVDLAPKSFWWTQPSGMPPVLQGRKDLLFESDESSSSQGGKVMMTKELFVLFQDYSQTIISAYFDSQNPADVKLEQRHEQPPSRLRQDQLEQAHERFGRRIFDAVSARKDSVIGDGSPHGMVAELLKPLSDALLPVGTRAYGALIYGNLANASTQQKDEIRPGDIVTLRNTKFQGKHGPLNAKYSMDVGKPDHVGVVAEWDGTKKKVRAWEQGRESKKVKLESFKLDDLRSGEVKIWRVMPRSWIGWEGQN